MEISKRLRANVGVSTTGVVTTDCTVEITSDGNVDTQPMVMEELARLKSALSEAYPTVPKVK